MAGQGSGPLLPRRGVLAATMAAPLLAAPLFATGCSRGFGALGTPPRPLPDVAVLTRAIVAETRLIARYQAVLARFPRLATALDPLLADHRAHLAGLRARLVPGAAQPSPSPSASSAASQPVPAGQTAAVAYLGAAEDAAAAALLGRLAAASPSLAQLLASIAASEATHAAALGYRVTG